MSDKIKTLSQAIRLGSTFREQAFGSMSIGSATCAMGAAFEAIGGDFDEMPLEALPACKEMYVHSCLRNRFPHAFMRLSQCPVSGCYAAHPPMTGTLYSTISHLNDHHRWTREQIADWLESKGL